MRALLTDDSVAKLLLTALIILIVCIVGLLVETWKLHRLDGVEATFLGILTIAIIAMGILLWSNHGARGRDLDGRYAASPLKPWFDGLKSGKGLCCSDADGTAITDADWDVKDGHYRVRIEDEWWPVPDDAIITEPNRVGRTMVWPNPTRGLDNRISKMDIRCFLPGSMT
jgi:hypothetical protein